MHDVDKHETIYDSMGGYQDHIAENPKRKKKNSKGIEGEKLSSPQELFWTFTGDEALASVNTSRSGLSSREAANRLGDYGANALPEEEEDGLLAQLIDAFKDPLSLVLTGAAILSAIVGLLQGESENLQQALFIMGIVLFMVLTGYITDQRAGNALKKLKQLQETYATVLRDGKLIEVLAHDLTIGDIISLKEGDKVPADALVIEATNAKTNEALLTGEPFAVTKNVNPLAANTDLAKRSNMVYTGSYVEQGIMTALVVGVGLGTELGKIYSTVQNADEGETPLQQQLEKLGQFLLKGTLVVCFAVVGIYVLRGENILDAVIDAVALAIAFIPEALGAVITISLALGVNSMVKKGAIIKRLRAAEALGSVSVVLTDKTGTVTLGKMTATEIWTVGYGPRRINGDNKFFGDPDVQRLMHIAQLCNNLQNPTEKALAEMAALAGLDLSADSRSNRLFEVPFSSNRKLMTTAYRNATGLRLQTKGAPDRLVQRCSFVLANGEGVIPMTPEIAKQIHEAAENYETKGYRVLAFADRDLNSENITEEHEHELTFVGLIALSDPPRPEVRGAIFVMNDAGVTAKMITGDSPLTALTIAKEVGMVPQDTTLNQVMLGSELEGMLQVPPEVSNLTPYQINRILSTRVFARTSPVNKIKLVEVHKNAGLLVAMAGDGVNDAAALKEANVGIAMEGGTDITKEVADVVLTGTYSAIASAIEVGRVILQRTRLYCHALLSTNGAEVGIFILAAIFGWAAPFSALQLLLINFIGDSWLSIALTTEEPEADTMQQPPRDPAESVITPYMYRSIALQSAVTSVMMAVGWVFAGWYAENQHMSPEVALTMQHTAIFCIFMTQKVLRSSFTARSLKYNIWQIGVFSNKWCLVAAAATTVIGVGAMTVPAFGMMVLPVGLLPLLIFGLVPPIAEEIVKLGRRTRSSK